jgi:hypothetical protein
MVSCPLFEGNLWESSQNHIDDFLSFCQSIGVYDIHTSADLFPLSLHGKVGDWSRRIVSSQIFTGESIFVKFLIDFPPPPIFHHFEFLPESILDPPRCDFFYGPHEQLTCGLFLKAKNEYHTNPSLFMTGLQENNHASRSAIFTGDCKDYCLVMPTNPTFENDLFDAFPFNDDLFEAYPTQDQPVSNEVLLMDESGREDSLNLNSTIPHISHDYSEKDERGDSSGHIGSYVGSSFENPMRIIKILHCRIPSQTHCFSSERLRKSMTIVMSPLHA